MVPGISDINYILMLREYLSLYCWLFPFSSPTAENTTEALLEWCSSFRIPEMLMSDQGSHLKNETVRELARRLRVPHHFTLPYSSWSNGAVERIGKELQRFFRSTLSELGMQSEEWPDLVPLVQSGLNNSPSSQRGNIAPITIFSGSEPSSPLSYFRRHKTAKNATVSEAVCPKSFDLSLVQQRLSQLHPVVENTLKCNRERGRNATSRGKFANFSVGDFVLVARSEFSKGEQQALRWRGPRRVVKTLSRRST